MRTTRKPQFDNWMLGYVLILVLSCLPRTSTAGAITEIRVDMVATIPELPMTTDDKDVSTTDDDLAVSVVGSSRGGGVRHNYFAFAEGTSRFGGSTDIRVIDAGPNERRSKVSGEWSAVYRKEADHSGQIPFRISNTKLELGGFSAPGDSAEWFFAFDTVPSTLTATRDQVIDTARLTYDGNSYVTTLKPEVLTGSLDVSGTGGNTLASYEFDVYEDSLDVSTVPVDSLFSLNYRWNTIINVDSTSYGKAQFYDPLTDEGGISFDTTGLTLITDPVTNPDPVAVPEPASTTFGMLAFGILATALRGAYIRLIPKL